MGGVGSGRPPSVETIIARTRPEPLEGGSDFFIPNLSGVKQSAIKDWKKPDKTIGITIDGGGSAITTGVKGYVEVPYDMTITGWTLLADQSGSIVIDVWKDTYGNFPPTVADTIAGTEKPTITTATKGQDTSLSTWTTTVTAGDCIGFNVDSCSTITRATLIIKGVSK